MATIVNMHQAKTELSSLVTRAEAGEEIVIARRNRPAVRLMPVEMKRTGPRIPGALAHLAGDMPSDIFLQPPSEEDLEEREGGHATYPLK
ncbi:type II toxin-antitoxin system prevent-host-death family antitoxin [Fulvimarina sp. MAC3]|uniref:type II toxin-antitoxin system Phd/YefM family antitoxin n=1 Tax=Fulvimarina sp. MAC3 TaxID=3148887 RepID=UPI0031FC216D